jgi:ABC-2 type transport system ATP-binding protein
MTELSQEELNILGGAPQKRPTRPVIIAQDIFKYYKRYGMISRGKLALNDLTLTINQGESVALLGPNGAGKTTFLRLLFGLIFPTSGSLKVLEFECDDACWKGSAGYVPELFAPPKFLTGLEILRMAAKSRKMSRDEFNRRVDWLDEKIGVKEMLPLKIKEYSRGMLQQFAIAESLVHDPDLIVMDEPTSNLDALHRRKLKELFTELSQKGKTILISSHILSEVEEFCERAIFIDKGKVVQQGKILDLVAGEEGFVITFRTLNTMPEQLPRLGALNSDPALGKTTLEARSETEKDLAVKALTEAYISIDAIEPKHKTLEDVFLNLMQEKVLEKVVSELMGKNEE